jgi:hypothetical protein
MFIGQSIPLQSLHLYNLKDCCRIRSAIEYHSETVTCRLFSNLSGKIHFNIRIPIHAQVSQLSSPLDISQKCVSTHFLLLQPCMNVKYVFLAIDH